MSLHYKLAFIGEPGAGKTTCIAALSDIRPVDTEVACTDALLDRKATTTVALDYGELDLGELGKLLLYGLPGQRRFRFMFDVVRDGLVGIVLLVDATSPDGWDGFEETLQTYAESLRGYPCVVALNKAGQHDHDLLAECQRRLREHRVVAPVMRADVRDRGQVVRIAELIFTMLRYDARHQPMEATAAWA